MLVATILQEAHVQEVVHYPGHSRKTGEQPGVVGALTQQIHRPFQVLVGLEQALALSWRRLGEGGVAAEQSDPRMTGGQGRPWQVIAGPWKGVEDRLDRSLGSWALGFGQQGLPRPERESGTGWGGGGRG